MSDETPPVPPPPETPPPDDLDTGALAPPVETPPPPDEGDEGEVDGNRRPEPPQLAAARSAMKEELIEHRTVRRQLEGRMQELEPVLSRLTPELQQAIAEGRVLVKPLPVQSEDRKAALTKRAERLRLVTPDGEPDLDAAERVETEIRDVARQEVAPLREARARDLAGDNYRIAMQYAHDAGYSPEVLSVIKETFDTTPAQLLADPKIAKSTWEIAIGRAVSRGHTLPAAKPAAAAPPARGPAAIVTEATGRRGAAALTLTPALAKVYKDNGLDPAKSFSATKPNVDLSQGVELE